MNEVVVSNATSIADMFFGQEPLRTEWNDYLAAPEQLDPKELIAGLEALEPVPPVSPHEHKIFVAQQLLRIALRYAKGLPIFTSKVCAVCGMGSRKTDPVLEQCLYCAEFEEQMGDFGGRGSCFFVRPAYCPATTGWGLLYYQSHHHDQDFMFWLALGYGTWREAQLALYPIRLYEQWHAVKFDDLTNHWRMAEHLMPLEDVMKNTMPMNPASFQHFLRAMIVESLEMEHSMISWPIRQALDDYSRKMQE